MLWIANLDAAGSEPGAVVGGGGRRELALLYVGRVVIGALALDMLRQVLQALG